MLRSDFICAFIAGYPAQSIDDYSDGAAVVELFLIGAAGMKSISHLLTTIAIRNFRIDEPANWTSRESNGWTPQVRTRLLGKCHSVMARPELHELVESGLASSDDEEFQEASQVAQALGIDTWKYEIDRLRNSPQSPHRWFHVMQHCNAERISSVIDLATTSLPLSKIATGPSNELGMGPEFEAHSCLDMILQSLGQFPGHGERLIEVGSQKSGHPK